MYKDILNLSSDLVLIFDNNKSLVWTNKTFYDFQKKHNIKDIDDFFDIRKFQHKAEFKHSFQSINFDVKFSHKNDKHIFTFSENLQDKMYKLKYTDPITKCGNRELNMKNIDEFFEKRASNPKLKMVLCAIVFKKFENIDYFYGFEEGDRVLRYIANALQSLEKNNLICRISEEKFSLMHTYEEDDFDVNAYVAKISKLLHQPIEIDENNSVKLFANIGVVVLPKQGVNKKEVLKHVAIAHKQSLKKYENISISFYKEDLVNDVNENLQIEKRLDEALEKNHLELFYQPKIDLKNKTIYGFEALIRWRDPKEGIIMPLSFIPVAEDTGQIVKIGLWVLEQVCLQSNKWKKEGFNFKISLNISLVQLQDQNFVEKFKKVVQKTNVDTSLIELEITESILSENLNEIVELFTQIKQLGFNIALDDFGTGYSSLSYLRSIPVDVLKIDKTFIENICTSPKDATIAKTIISLSKNLSLKVVAEGAETENQVLYLSDLDCDFIQGYYYYKPMSLDKIQKVLEQSKSK